MATHDHSLIRNQLIDRRRRLEETINESREAAQYMRLLDEVDQALNRLNDGTYGICEVCKGTVEDERLAADPLMRFCLECLSPAQQRALQRDLDLAARIQAGLLPNRDLAASGPWQFSFHYEAAGPVSGDYCDVVKDGKGNFYFIVGDVSGKGVAAAMLMSNLHALFRSLIPVGLSLTQLMEQASRVFCESTLSTHYATLVCVKANANGEIEIVNAGHCPPVLIGSSGISTIGSHGLPLGMFCNEQFSVEKLQLKPGDALLLYTDGLAEAEDGDGNPYGHERLCDVARACNAVAPELLVGKCLQDLKEFTPARADDLTVMAVQWAPAEYSLPATERKAVTAASKTVQ